MSLIRELETAWESSNHSESLRDIAQHMNWKRYSYAHGVLIGDQLLSGADLKGAARAYGRGYYETRKTVVAWLIQNGLAHVRRTYRNGRLELVEGFAPDDAVPSRCAISECWVY